MENIEQKIRRIRKLIFSMPEEKQDQASRVIEKLKGRLPKQSQDYHWRYAAEN